MSDCDETLTSKPGKILDLLPGQVVADRYEVLDEIGKGNMGTVYKVLDRTLGNDLIALKYLDPTKTSDTSLIQRFQSEALIARKLKHPNLVGVFDYLIDEEGRHLISMEYVEGVSLEQKIDSSPGGSLEFYEATRILQEVCFAIFHAHEKGIIHRDLKPGNILLDHNETIKIVDFGLAKSFHIDGGVTQHGHCIGTACYISPEHIRGEELDERADIYAIGIMAYELIHGVPPFVGDTWFKIADQHLNSPIPNLRAQGADIPQWYQEFINRATQKERGARFPNAREAGKFILKKLGRLSAQTEKARIRRTALGKSSRKEERKPIRRGEAIRFPVFENATLVLFFALIVMLGVSLHASGIFDERGSVFTTGEIALPRVGASRVDPSVRSAVLESLQRSAKRDDSPLEPEHSKYNSSSGPAVWRCRHGESIVFRDYPKKGEDCKKTELVAK